MVAPMGARTLALAGEAHKCQKDHSKRDSSREQLWIRHKSRYDRAPDASIDQVHGESNSGLS